MLARALQLIYVLVVIAAWFVAPASAAGVGPEFVSVDGLNFVYRDARFFYAGTNCYYLSYFSADPVRRGSTDDLLDLCRDRGFNVIRAWAFNDGGWNVDGYTNEWAYQDTPTSVYNETALEGLDYAIDQAGRRGLSLLSLSSGSDRLCALVAMAMVALRDTWFPPKVGSRQQRAPTDRRSPVSLSSPAAGHLRSSRGLAGPTT